MVGFSRAADRTFLHIPEMRISLDAGHCRGRQTEHVFVTHTHMDHVKDISYMCKKENVVVHCPTSAIDNLRAYIHAEFVLDWQAPVDLDAMPFTLTPHLGDETFPIAKGNYVVRTFECFHKVPCLGYAFGEKRKRLKKEYASVAGKELGKLRKEGVQIDEEYVIPLFAYVGDTSTIVFEKTPWLFEYPVIITECTFLYDDGKEKGVDLKEKAAKDGHTHWDSLQPIILAHPETTFMLIHFSLRYSEQDVYNFFNGLINRDVEPLNLDNVVLFLGDHTEGRRDK